jgi:uncharacterized protein
METELAATYTAFAGQRKIVTADLDTMLVETKRRLDRGEAEPILIFDDRTGEQIDFDFRGSPDDVRARLASHPSFAAPEAPPPARSGPGRPKLGVVSREVSLLPRHWAWLEAQRGGMSVALRKLVDEARKRGQGKDRARAARDAASKFMWVMAGNLPGFEEATRALFAKDDGRLKELIRSWPKDIRAHVTQLVEGCSRLEKDPEEWAGDASR